MIQKLMAFATAMDDVLAAAVVGVGTALSTSDAGLGLVAFGGLWFVGARLDRRRA